MGRTDRIFSKTCGRGRDSRTIYSSISYYIIIMEGVYDWKDSLARMVGDTMNLKKIIEQAFKTPKDPKWKAYTAKVRKKKPTRYK